MLAKLDFKAAVAAAAAATAAVGIASSTSAVYKTGHDGFLQSTINRFKVVRTKSAKNKDQDPSPEFT